MHVAKARVHRSESGSLLAAMSEKEDLTRKHLKEGKRERKEEDKTKSESPPSLLNRKTRKTEEMRE